MQEYIALVDCDNFFVSCERLFRPELLSKPVLVLSSNDTCAISRSQEVKNLGIKMGDPYFKIKELCDKHKVTLFSSNFELYSDMSRRVMSVLRRYTDTIDVYSVDEAFLELVPQAGCVTDEDCEQSLLTQARSIRTAVLQEVGVPVSIGVAKTKTLAKVATHFAKPRFTSDGAVALVRKDAIQKALEEIPIGDVWGIGRAYGPKLVRVGIITAFDFCEQEVSWIQKHINMPGLRTVSELQGIRCFHIGESDSVRKSLMHSQSFICALHHLSDIEKSVVHHARKVAEILRAEEIYAREIGVFLYAREKDGTRHKVVGTEVEEVYTNSTLTIVATAHKVLKRIYSPTCTYTKSGVFVRNIVPEGGQPATTLFGENTNTHSSLMSAIDILRSKFGIVLQTGIEMRADKGRARRMYLSPRCSTRWEEVKKVPTL